MIKKLTKWIVGLLGISGGLFIFFIMMMFIIIIGIAGSSSQNEQSDTFSEGEYTIGNLSPEVLRYKSLVELYANQYGVSKYVPILLAIMQQESGGRGNDPMQASESYCGGKIGCIQNPEFSIERGIIHFKSVLEKANHDVKLALQSYNFGGGFIDWVQRHHSGKYSMEASIQFSKEMYRKEVAKGRGGNYSCNIKGAKEVGACYGDYMYAERIMKYVIVLQEGGAPVEIVGDKAWIVPFTKNITSGFGPRWGTIHKGVDIAAGGIYGKPIVAFRDGVVIISQLSGTVSGGLSGKGYGYHVVVDHGDGMKTKYAHMASLGVPVGTQVKAGQEIGKVGSTGNSSGPHLHFEILINDRAVDPMPYLTSLLGAK